MARRQTRPIGRLGSVQRHNRYDGYRWSGSQNDDTNERITSGLGWFSLGLGVTQLVAPGGLNTLIGAPNTETARSLQGIVGLREIAAGIGILHAVPPGRLALGRVAGDLMDLVLLGSAFTARGSGRARLDDGDGQRPRGRPRWTCTSAIQVTRKGGSTRRSSEGGGVHTRKTVTVGRSPEEVYRFWHDFENLPRFMRHLESVEIGRAGGRTGGRKAPPG